MGAWEARSATPKMKKEMKVSIATLNRGECVESSLSPLDFSQSLLLRNEGSMGKIGAFLVAKGGGGVNRAPFG